MFNSAKQSTNVVFYYHYSLQVFWFWRRWCISDLKFWGFGLGFFCLVLFIFSLFSKVQSFVYRLLLSYTWDFTWQQICNFIQKEKSRKHILKSMYRTWKSMHHICYQVWQAATSKSKNTEITEVLSSFTLRRFLRCSSPTTLHDKTFSLATSDTWLL